MHEIQISKLLRHVAPMGRSVAYVEYDDIRLWQISVRSQYPFFVIPAEHLIVITQQTHIRLGMLYSIVPALGKTLVIHRKNSCLMSVPVIFIVPIISTLVDYDRVGLYMGFRYDILILKVHTRKQYF